MNRQPTKMKRTVTTAKVVGSIGAASACSGPGAAESIARNLATGQAGLGILGGIFLVSLAVALRTRRYAFPIALGSDAILVWVALGTAYSGDGGSTAHDAGVFGVVLGVGAVASQIFLERLTMHKRDPVRN